MTDWKKKVSDQDGKTFVFEHYGLAPSVIFRDPTLSVGAKALYGHLVTFVNCDQMKRGKLHAWPSRERIMRDLSISVNTFGKYLRELKEAKLIRVEQGRKTLEGRQVYGNNLYILETHVTEMGDAEGASQANHNLAGTSGSESDSLKLCDALKLNTSNTQGFSNTKNKGNTNLSFSTPEEASCSQDLITEPGQHSYPDVDKEQRLSLDDVIKAWNRAGVNVHHGLGRSTKARIQKALDVAREEHSDAELLKTITTYAKLYRDGIAKHRYRLVEFLEKRGYEHFLDEENWQRSPSVKAPGTRQYFKYQGDLSEKELLDLPVGEYSAAISKGFRAQPS